MNTKTAYLLVLLSLGSLAYTSLEAANSQLVVHNGDLPIDTVLETTRATTSESSTQITIASSHLTDASLASSPEKPVMPVEMPAANETQETSEAAIGTDVSPIETVTRSNESRDIPTVPFYSQFTDISLSDWKKVGCGIASLAMIIEYHKPGAVGSVDFLLQQGIAADAYLNDAGWIHAGLISLAEDYGLTGESRSLSHLNMTDAFEELTSVVAENPVMASVHYTFDPQNPIPHLVVVTGVADDRVYYNDPADSSGGHSIPEETFKLAWKKRYIEIH